MAKKWLIAAACLLIAGVLMVAGALAALDFDFSRLSTVAYETNTYEINEAFSSISIRVHTTDIVFALSQDDSCKIVCRETEKVRHSSTVQDETLIIDVVDSRKWYDHIGIFLGNEKMTVYLPQKAYTSLSVDTNTGDIQLPKDFTFETIHINGDTADVSCMASVADSLKIKITTGNIKASGLTTDRIELTTSTGNIKLTDVGCNDLTLESDTGDISMKNLVASGSCHIESDTGDVKFDSCDGGEIFVETDTGDVTGTLRSEMVFITDTDTGRIRVPKTVNGGRCEISTDTGDIEIEIIS